MRRRMAFDLFESTDNGQSSGGELCELMVEFCPPGQLAGCDDVRWATCLNCLERKSKAPDMHPALYENLLSQL